MTSVGRWAGIRESAVLFEDEAVLVLNKPAGISVMGERHETDLVRLAQEDGEELFPVHRIDKVTSGAILFAKELRHHGDLTRQFNKRTVGKSYLAITRTSELPEGGRRALPASGTIDLPLGVGRKNRVRVAGNREDIVASEDGRRWSLGSASDSASSGSFGDKKSYPSRTDFARAWGDDHHDLLALRPVTGRRHQIRVHLAWIGHPIEGDPLFDKAAASRGDRCALHAWRLAFDAAWASGRRIALEAPPGADFWGVLGDGAGAVPEGVLDGVRDW
ncbi:RluA family pseudouridine synthase [Streptomyces odontomachi]|uniref:RluA family pseudouridine synthase n=1 Tax=Streptomyces odontomachi TaxID=2944940 RepID=UPI00210C99E7|nr:RluA family pseudouridine synthase [Streptomyces sp. ODS25]